MHTINTTNWNIRTDLIIEKDYDQSASKEQIKKEKYTIDRIKTNNKNYTTISFDDITDKDNFKEIENTLINELKLFLKNVKIKKEDPVLIIGLGNSN